jgi:hypothetical protein
VETYDAELLLSLLNGRLGVPFLAAYLPVAVARGKPRDRPMYKHAALVEWEDGYAVESKTDSVGIGTFPSPSFCVCAHRSSASIPAVEQLIRPRAFPSTLLPNVTDLVVVSGLPHPRSPFRSPSPPPSHRSPPRAEGCEARVGGWWEGGIGAAQWWTALPTPVRERAG